MLLGMCAEVQHGQYSVVDVRHEHGNDRFSLSFVDSFHHEVQNQSYFRRGGVLS